MIEPRGINHIGIAVRSIDANRDFYERILGARFEGIHDVPAQNVRVAFFAVGQGERAIRLELIEPTSPDTAIARFIETHGEGLHHLTCDVTNLDDRLAALKAGGTRLIDDRARAGAHGTRIAFLHPESTHGVLFELCETIADDRPEEP